MHLTESGDCRVPACSGCNSMCSLTLRPQNRFGEQAKAEEPENANDGKDEPEESEEEEEED